MKAKELFALSAARWNACVNTALDDATEFLTFWLFVALSSIGRWWTLKRVCAWCKPPRWMGGNPFAKQVTHGICRACRLKFYQHNNLLHHTKTKTSNIE